MKKNSFWPDFDVTECEKQTQKQKNTYEAIANKLIFVFISMIFCQK